MNAVQSEMGIAEVANVSCVSWFKFARLAARVMPVLDLWPPPLASAKQNDAGPIGLHAASCPCTAVQLR